MPNPHRCGYFLATFMPVLTTQVNLCNVVIGTLTNHNGNANTLLAMRYFLTSLLECAKSFASPVFRKVGLFASLGDIKQAKYAKYQKMKRK